MNMTVPVSGDRPAVLLLTRHYAPEPTGSAPPLQQLAEWLAREGIATQVVTSRPSYPEARIFPGYEAGQRDDVLENGVYVRRWPTWPAKGASLLSRVLPEARFLTQLLVARLTGRLSRSRHLISLCPSILTVLGATFCRASGGRHVVIVHDIQSGLGSALGSSVVRAIMTVLRLVERYALNRADELVVLSQAMTDELRRIGVTTPVTILPPQIDCSKIVPLPRPEGQPVTLMYSGNLGRKQGLDQVLDMAALLKARAPEVVVLIRGQGAMKAQIEERIATDALSNVRLEGLAPVERMTQSIAQGDIHLVPQIAEGGDFAVPSKAFTIMAAGRPFITTATAGSSIGRMAGESGAFAVTPPNDPAAFVETIMTLLADPARRAELGARGRDFALATADNEVVMRRLYGLLSGTSAAA